MRQLRVNATAKRLDSAVVSRISLAKNSFQGPEENPRRRRPRRRRDDLSRVASSVRQVRRRAPTRSTSTTCSVEPVRAATSSAEVRDRWRRRFRYVLVDEYQDTNRVQFELVRQLADGHRNLCVVGDDDQSIYGWRGAEVSNILEFEQHFPNPKVVKLEQNYRSTSAILTTANALIKNNPRRRPKQLWSDKGDGERVRVIRMPDDRKEAEFVAEDINRLRIISAIRGRTSRSSFA